MDCIENESQIQPAYQSRFAQELERSMQQAEMPESQRDLFASQPDIINRAEETVNPEIVVNNAESTAETTSDTVPNSSQYATPCSSQNQFLANESQFSLNNSEGQTQSLSSTQAFATQNFLAQPMSPILTKTLAAPKTQTNLDNMFLGGHGRKHSEAFKTKVTNKRNTASVTHSNIFLNIQQNSSDESDIDEDDNVFIENTQQDKSNRTFARAKRTKATDKFTADMEKKQRKAFNKRTKELNKQIEKDVDNDNDDPISNADLKMFMFNMNKAVDNLQKGQQETNKIITKEIERTVSQTVEQSLGNINTRLKTVESDVKNLKDAEIQNQATRDFAKNQAEINKSHDEAIDKLTETMLLQSKELERITKEMQELKTTGVTTSSSQGQSSENPTGNINFTWDAELTRINQENEYNLVLIFGQHLKQTYKSIVNDAIAKEVMIQVHNEVIKRFKLKGTQLDKFNGIRFKKTMANNIVKVFFDNFNDKASYRHLITQLPYNIRPYVDQAIPPPYTECYRQFKDIAFDIRASGEYKTNIRIISNWMVILTQKKSDDNNNPWERVPEMEFYPPVPGTKDHKNLKATTRRDTRTNNANQDQTLTNSGDLDKIKKTVCISTQPKNIIPDIQDNRTKQEFMGFIAIKLRNAKINFLDQNIKWNDRNVTVQFETIPNAWEALNALLGTTVPWPQIQETLHLKCSLLGYKPIPTRNQRKNSFLAN